MGCGNSKAVTTVASTSSPQAKPGSASNEANNNQTAGQSGKISPPNDATEPENTEGIYTHQAVGKSKFVR